MTLGVEVVLQLKGFAVAVAMIVDGGAGVEHLRNSGCYEL